MTTTERIEIKSGGEAFVFRYARGNETEILQAGADMVKDPKCKLDETAALSLLVAVLLKAGL